MSKVEPLKYEVCGKSGDKFAIVSGPIILAEYHREDTARTACIALNACISLCPDDPLRAAEKIERAFKLLAIFAAAVTDEEDGPYINTAWPCTEDWIEARALLQALDGGKA